MTTIRAFKAVRPDRRFAHQVAALPYDVMNSDEAREMAKDNPYSFLHVDKAEIDLEIGVDLYDDRVYNKAKENLDKMLADHVLFQDEKPCLYVYQLIMNGRKQTGLVVCTAIDDYLNNTIKKHELTRPDKETDRIRHVSVCNANTGPIFLMYKADAGVRALIENTMQSKNTTYDFLSDNGVTHKIWVIDDEPTIDALVEAFKSVPNFYIADGHHRNAAAVKVGLKRRSENPNYDKDAEFNYYLSVVFPDDQLAIMDYNRVVKDLNGLSKAQFLNKISEKFMVEKSQQAQPDRAHTFAMYCDGEWYRLTVKDAFIPADCVGSLDVSILQNELLGPILAIDDPRTNNRIDFVGGIRGVKELVKRVDSGEMAVAFAMFPTTIRELMAVADEDKLMPPKSTWFEPKLRSGLFIHMLD